MSMYNTSSTGFTITTADVTPVKTPTGILVTRSVETKAGWVGQIIVDKDIIWESASPHHESGDAVREANERVVDKLRRLFA